MTRVAFGRKKSDMIGDAWVTCRRSSGKEGRQEGDMAPSKGRDLAPLRDMGRDLPQLRRESAPIKGRAMNRKSSGWMGTSWRTLLLGLIFLVLAATTLMISQVFDGKRTLSPLPCSLGFLFQFEIPDSLDVNRGACNSMPSRRSIKIVVCVLHSYFLIPRSSLVSFC